MGSILDSILSPFLRVFSFLRSLIIYKIRIDGVIATNFFEFIKKSGKVITINEEFVLNGLPRMYDAFAYIQGVYISFTITERLLRAGFQGTDRLINVAFLRFQKEKLYNLLKTCTEKARDDIPVFILRPWCPIKIGSLKNTREVDLPYLHPDYYKELEKSIKEIANHKIEKTGAILYGSPGNGKSFLVRYFALKYKLPIYCVTFDQDLSNTDIIKMFSEIEGPAIILMEDFDAYFNKRIPMINDLKFSFDSILNVIDGAFTTHKNLAFFLTANNIDNVDVALKNRPSRFKYVKEIENPSEFIRKRIFNGKKVNGLIKKTKGYSLDMLLHMNESLSNGRGIPEVIKEAEEMQKISYELKEWQKIKSTESTKNGESKSA